MFLTSAHPGHSCSNSGVRLQCSTSPRRAPCRRSVRGGGSPPRLPPRIPHACRAVGERWCSPQPRGLQDGLNLDRSMKCRRLLLFSAARAGNCMFAFFCDAWYLLRKRISESVCCRVQWAESAGLAFRPFDEVLRCDLMVMVLHMRPGCQCQRGSLSQGGATRETFLGPLREQVLHAMNHFYSFFIKYFYACFGSFFFLRRRIAFWSPSLRHRRALPSYMARSRCGWRGR